MRYNWIMMKAKKMTTTLKILMMLESAGSCEGLSEKQIIDVIRPYGCSERWGNSYFLKGRGNGHKVSLIKRGLIDIVRINENNGRMYAISDDGRAYLARKSS